MTKKFKRTLVTAALPYANGGVHIGHLAGVYVPADIYVRYLRLRGEPVLFICGSDEHGVPVTMRARKEGITTQEVVDRYNELISRSFKEFGISFDTYGRTTSATHRRVAQEFFTRLYNKGELIEQESEQYYDPEARVFLADRYIVGECPKCHHEGAYGDQCEACGTSLSPTELINPHSTVSGSKPEMRKTKHWYLPLDRYQEWLEQWILKGHPEWRSNVYGQCKSWLDGGLKPRAVSRDLDWGIPVPLKEAEGKVLYVWFDAPIGYISNTIDLRPDDWKLWWQSEDSRLVHFIGKDNIVFHCIVFPVMLKAVGDFVLPDNVPANEFLNLEDQKISTSRNYAVWLHDYLADFPGKQDVLRYVLTANAPETKDNNFTWRDFQARNNNELVAVLGNFVNRALQLTKKYYGGVVPALGNPTEGDKAVLREIGALREKVDSLLATFHFRDAQHAAMDLARLGNKYLAESEPWKLQKTEPERVETILNISLQIVANLAVAFAPFLPASSEKLAKMINLEGLTWQDFGRTDLLPAGKLLCEPALLFEKIEDAAIEAQIAKLAPSEPAVAPIKQDVQFEDFEKLDLRIGTIKACNKVEGKDRLLQFTIDDGLGERTIVSGIAQFYKPEELVGKQVCFIANLKPRKIAGIVSQGMLLSAATEKDGKIDALSLLQPQREMPGGTQIS